MSYSIIDLEVTQPLPTLQTKEEETGIALVVRRKDRPIGLVMQELPPNSVLTPDDLAQLLSREISTKLLQESIREELMSPGNREQFPSLTVAICTKDRPDNVARCLESLLKLQRLDGSPCFEILVVDNAPSDDRTKDIIDKLPSVCYAREPKAGLDFARNRALQEATGEILAYLDDDVTVDRQWFNGLVEAWTENPDAGAFTGLVLPYELVTPAQILFEQRGGFRRGFEKIRYGQTLPGSFDYPCGAGRFGAGCNMAFRREALLKLGGFDEALDTGAPLPGGGDIDIFYRIVRAGYPLVYEPRYLVFHQHRRDYAKLRRQYWSWGLGVMAFIVKSYQSDPSQRFKLLLLLVWWFKDKLSLLLKSIKSPQSLPPSMIWAELWGGLVGLVGEYPRSQSRVEKIRRQFSGVQKAG